MTNEFVTYADWSNNASDIEPTNGANLTATTLLQGVDLYLTRETQKKNTFTIHLDDKTAIKLLEFLKERYE